MPETTAGLILAPRLPLRHWQEGEEYGNNYQNHDRTDWPLVVHMGARLTDVAYPQPF